MVLIRELYRNKESYLGNEITVSGWVRNNRDQKQFGFIDLHDGTSFHTLQVVYDDGLKDFQAVTKYLTGSSLTVTGILVATPDAKQPFELKATGVVLEGACDETYPIQPKRHTVEFLRKNAHLRPRTNLFYATFKVRSLVAHAIHEFFREREFIYVHTPIITGSDAEGAGEVFGVTTIDPLTVPMTEDGEVDYKQDFFAKKTGLTVSGQLEAETFALAFRDVYTFGPTFRAENSNTTRHAAEFWMIEPEIAFADLEDDMNLAENMVKYIIRYVLENAPDEMAFLNQFVDKGLIERLTKVANSDFKRLDYTEAITLLEEAAKTANFENEVYWGVDLATEHERYLVEKIFDGPVFLKNYPEEIKAFYMRMNDDGKTVAASDLLVPGIGELIGGSQREERLDVLEARMDKMGIPKDDLEWYLDLRRYGGVKHAGFGLGFERMVMYMTGVENIRDVVPFPRTPKNAEF
ncbi:MAG: asparagine--tRNA ligase [Culicoidibacterales bacterium]